MPVASLIAKYGYEPSWYVVDMVLNSYCVVVGATTAPLFAPSTAARPTKARSRQALIAGIECEQELCHR